MERHQNRGFGAFAMLIGLKSWLVISCNQVLMTSSTESLAVAQYLADHPEFFTEHAELLARVKLPSPAIGKAVSLQERQVEILREKYRKLELRMNELTAVADENSEIMRRYKAWTRVLLLARDDVDLPYALTDGLRQVFDMPDASLRLWGVREEEAHKWYAANVDDDVRLFANSLTAPYCGPNRDFGAASWLDAGEEMASVAILPLRHDDAKETFGLLIMGSPDAARFSADMSTDFLVDIAETASAALTCLLE